MAGEGKRIGWIGAGLLCSLALAGCSAEEADGAAVVAAAAPSVPAKAALAAGSVETTPAPQKAATPFSFTSILTPDRPLRHGDYLWNDEGVAPGPLSIVVDLQAQIVYVYRGGIEIGRSAILYGADDKPTPTGTFPILQRKRHHISNLYGAPMPYMLRLTNDGIAIHGSTVEYGAATHGCVGVPDEFAANLFAQAKVGDRVLITNGWHTDVYGT